MKKIVILGSLLLLVLAGCSLSGIGARDILSLDEAKAKAETFINTTLMSGGNTAVVEEIIEEDGLYKIVVNVGDDKIDSYISKDGTKFFPQVMTIDGEAVPADGGQGDAPAAEVSVKNDKPVVEVFVMSHCPYGTQIEKGILPVVETLGNKIDFELKFCDYAMHGEPELDEQLNQYCIQKEQGDKFLSYLTCFLEDSDSSRCVTKVGVNKSKMNSCVAKTDKDFKVKELFADKSTWQGGSYPVFNVYKDDNTKYSVGGSPTLIINGEQISSGRDSASLLGAICSGFIEAPEQCNTDLSSTSPAPGFGVGAAAGGGSDAATCN